MSTVVCQGLQPYLDQPHLVETTTMRLKVVTPPTSLGLARGSFFMVDNHEFTKEKCQQNHDGLDGSGNWNFFQSLTSSSPPKKEITSSYTYTQSSMLRLSEKSLELCTERLGSESGSDTSDESSILSLSVFDEFSRQNPRSRTERNFIPAMESSSSSRKAGKAAAPKFPPPLTTISGSNSLQVKPHREGGRLIIQAMEAPSTHSYFHTERSHGRLRLSLWENMDYDFHSDNAEEEDVCEEEETNVEDEICDVKSVYDDEENVMDVKKNINILRWDMDGNSNEAEVGMGTEKFQGTTLSRRRRRRTGRCKEDGHGGAGGDHKGAGRLSAWGEAFWVATS